MVIKTAFRFTSGTKSSGIGQVAKITGIGTITDRTRRTNAAATASPIAEERPIVRVLATPPTIVAPHAEFHGGGGRGRLPVGTCADRCRVAAGSVARREIAWLSSEGLIRRWP